MQNDGDVVGVDTGKHCRQRRDARRRAGVVEGASTETEALWRQGGQVSAEFQPQSGGKRRILSLCTSAGLMDKVFVDHGYEVVPGCEIMPHKRAIYNAWVGGQSHLCNDLADLPKIVAGHKFFGIIGGIPCQSFSKTKNLHEPKFQDLTTLVKEVLEVCECQWFLFENVVPLKIPGAAFSRMNAMNYAQPPQSRLRWFTHSQNLTMPDQVYPGNVDDLMAYSVVAGRIYGPKRAAVLQGVKEFASLPFPCKQLQEALADGVTAGVTAAWIPKIKALEQPYGVVSA